MSFILLGILNSQAAAGGAGAYDLLETTELTSSASSVTFSGLDSYTDYKHLQVRAVMKNTLTSNLNYNALLQINGENATSSYISHLMNGSGSSVSSRNENTFAGVHFRDAVAGNQVSNIFSGAIIDILDFSSTNKNTTVRSFTGSITGETDVVLGSGLFINTSAVTSLSFKNDSGDFVAGSRFSLYGVKG